MTRLFVLTSDWQEVGVGRLLAEAKHPNFAHLHFGLTPPSADERAFHDLNGPDCFAYGGTLKTYARRGTGAECEIVVTEGV